MKLNDIANRIDKSKQNEVWIEIMRLGEEFEVDVSYVEQDRLKCYWVGKWRCTDSDVGYRMYFLDDQPVGYSEQLGRKSYEKFRWFSIDCANKVKEHLLTLSGHKDELNINIMDINEEVGESFKIEFNEQIQSNDRITLNNEKVEILERIKNEPYGIDTELKIRLSTGEEKYVNIRDLDFGYHII